MMAPSPLADLYDNDGLHDTGDPEHDLAQRPPSSPGVFRLDPAVAREPFVSTFFIIFLWCPDEP